MTFRTERSEHEAVTGLIYKLHGDKLSYEDQKALEACTSQASSVWVGYNNDNPVCAWGLVPPTLLSDSAYLWLYSTPEVEECKFLFIRHSQIVMEEMTELYPHIWGVTKVDQTRSIRWLKWLGAKYGTPVNGLVPFTITKGNRNG